MEENIIQFENDRNAIVSKYRGENISADSVLIVHESQEALFFRNGMAEDLFGPGKHHLDWDTADGDGESECDSSGIEIYFINMAVLMGIKWGTDSKVRLFDPASGIHIEIGASGEFNIHVTDSRKLIVKLVGTGKGLDQSDILEDESYGTGYFKAMIMTQVKSYLARTIRECNLNILEIDEHLAELSDALKDRLNRYLEVYGLEMPEFFVSRIITPDDDEDYQRMRRQYAREYLEVRDEQIKNSVAQAASQRKETEARTEAELKRIRAGGDADAYLIKKRAEAEARQLGSSVFGDNKLSEKQVNESERQENEKGPQGTPFIYDKAEKINEGNAWRCICGMLNSGGNFCSNCGAKRPESENADDQQNAYAPEHTWDCVCGMKDLVGNFCTNCGRRRPEEL